MRNEFFNHKLFNTKIFVEKCPAYDKMLNEQVNNSYYFSLDQGYMVKKLFLSMF